MRFLPDKRLLYLFSTALLTGIFYILYAALENGEESIPLYMFIYFEAFLLFFFAYYLIKKIKRQSPKAENYLALFFIISGVIFRLILFPASPSTSDDVYRYIWEGKILVSGYNPFTHSPSDAELTHLHSEMLPAKVSFPHMSAFYPPLSQLTFGLAYVISGESFWGLKLIYLLCEILTMLILLKLLQEKKKDLKLILMYAWLPLPIMEFFINIHLDPTGILFLILFIYAIEKNNFKLGAIALAFSLLAKLYPLFLLPLLIKKIGLKSLSFFLLIFISVLALFYLPFIYKEIYIIGSLTKYLLRWEFNGSVFSLLKFLFNGEAARIACGILFALSVISISILYKDFIKGVFGIFLCFIIFSATVYPWYLSWLAALNPFVQFYSVLSLFFTINLSNFTPLGAEWREYRIVLVAEYMIFFLLLFYDLYVRRKLRADKDDNLFTLTAEK